MRQLAKVSPAPRKRDSAGAGHEAHTEEAQRSVQSEVALAAVNVLYRQIGQLKVENDFLARRLGK